jgi:hypothetical protein
LLARQQPLVSEDTFVPDVLREFGFVYPEKAVYVGENGLRLLIESGLQSAKSYGFSTPRAWLMTVTLMFAFGHRCFEDMLYPWIGQTVTNGAAPEDSDARAKRLEKKSLTWLHHVLANFGDEAPA